MKFSDMLFFDNKTTQAIENVNYISFASSESYGNQTATLTLRKANDGRYYTHDIESIERENGKSKGREA